MAIVALAQLLDGVIGATSLSKAWVLSLLAARAQFGTVVEVGVMFGKSAFPLALGARESGALLVAVDIWDNDDAVQGDSPPILQEAAHSWNRRHMQSAAEELIAVAGCDYEVVRGDTAAAIRQVSETRPESLSKVSLLHIDGNHDFEKVKADWDLWRPFLTEDHVLVFDDTAWAAGNGPRSVVNSIIQQGIYSHVVDYQGSTFFWGGDAKARGLTPRPRPRSKSVHKPGGCRIADGFPETLFSGEEAESAH